MRTAYVPYPLKIAGSSLAIGLAVAVGGPLSHATQVYFKDFETSIGPEWYISSGGGTLGIEFDGGAKFLGLADSLANGGFGNNTVQLSLSALPPHNALTVSFDFNALRSMDGGFNWCGPDYFRFMLDSFHRTTTVGGPTQAYPSFIETGGTPRSNSPYTGGAYVGVNGVYSPMSFTIPNTERNVSMQFSMNGLQGVFDEGRGLDNVSITAITPPSVATLARLAEDVYRPTALGANGYSIFDGVSSPHGFSANAYTNGDNVVVAIRGTAGSAITTFAKNLLADATWVINSASDFLGTFAETAAQFLAHVSAR